MHTHKKKKKKKKIKEDKYTQIVWRFTSCFTRATEASLHLVGKPCCGSHICCIHLGMQVQDDSLNAGRLMLLLHFMIYEKTKY